MQNHREISAQYILHVYTHIEYNRMYIHVYTSKVETM